jgi:hypothetical protein
MQSVSPNKMEQNVTAAQHTERPKFTLYGVEIVEKKVSVCNKGGRIYLPLGWLGKRVKIVRID